MTIHFNTPLYNGICAKRTNPAELRILAAALVAATLGLHSGLSQATESAGPPAMAPVAAHPRRARTSSISPTPAWCCVPVTWASPPTRRALAVSTWT
jgi:hypothetical protein